MRAINMIGLHHSASSWGNAFEIDKWHKEFDPPFDCIGYHFVVLNGVLRPNDLKFKTMIGSIESGRDLNRAGAHIKGHNKNSIGICMIHDDGDTYEEAMFKSLFYLCKELMEKFELPASAFKGHYELDPENKPNCPGFDVEWFRYALQHKNNWNFWDRFCV